MWKLKNNSINYDLKWSIVSYTHTQVVKAHPYTGGTRKFDPCLTENLAIMKAGPESLLNTRDEFVSKCRHMNKFTLNFLKKKLLIKYISSFFLKDLWDIFMLLHLKNY